MPLYFSNLVFIRQGRRTPLRLEKKKDTFSIRTPSRYARKIINERPLKVLA